MAARRPCRKPSPPSRPCTPPPAAVAAVVTTAAPMTAAQSKGVAEALRAALGKAPEIETRVDPALLGGIRVRVGSKLFDASLRSKLDSLKFALKRA